tara:strand:- start:178 stop:546 length:369 start_codon:yes stop_codon:yes gene_type:complete
MAMTEKERRIFEQGKKRRKVKEAIRTESKDGMYDGPGLGKAKGREMAERVKAEDTKDAQKYGGMDVLTTEQAKQMAEKKAYGGKVKKMADGKMVKKKKKTTKVVRRRGDGCAVRGKTKGRMV